MGLLFCPLVLALQYDQLAWQNTLTSSFHSGWAARTIIPTCWSGVKEMQQQLCSSMLVTVAGMKQQPGLSLLEWFLNGP